MSRKLISSMNLPDATANIFAARSLHLAKDVLARTELDLMELLDVPLPILAPALARIHECVCPPYRTVLSMWIDRQTKEVGGGHLATDLPELDHALGGGIPFGLITELVGPAAVGKSQMCLMLSVLTAMPTTFGGLDGGVIYIDTEQKFSSGRMMEIAVHKFPDFFSGREMLQKLAIRVLILNPKSVADLMESLKQLERLIIERSAKLVIIDSVAALLQSEFGRDRLVERQEMLGQQASLLKFIAEAFRIPVVVTNQVRTRSDPQGQVPTSYGAYDLGEGGGLDNHLTAALGTKWAHSVNVRLVLEPSVSGKFWGSELEETEVLSFPLVEGNVFYEL